MGISDEPVEEQGRQITDREARGDTDRREA